MDITTPGVRLMIGIKKCEEMLALPLPAEKKEEWEMRLYNAKQGLHVLDQTGLDQDIDLNKKFLAFIDNGKAAEYRHTHG